MTETATETVLEVFIPGPGENPEDPQDMERSIFLGAAQEALDSGIEIEVYATGAHSSNAEGYESVEYTSISRPESRAS